MLENMRWAVLVSLALAFVSVCRTSHSAGGESESAAAEAVRKADAAWGEAAATGNVDAWMAFYASDAIVRLPNEPLMSGKELVHPAVTRLLRRPRLSVAWHSLKLEISASGDQAYVIAAYELRFADSRAVSSADRGRRLEIWRLQSDDTWRCIIDTWNLDEPGAVLSAPAPAPAPTAPNPSSATPVEKPSTPAPTPPPVSQYGDKPVHFTEAVQQYFLEHLTDPASVRYREITSPEPGYVTGMSGTLLMRETRTYGWIVKATINAKDSRGRYVGFQTYTFLFRGEEIAATRSALFDSGAH